MTDRMGRYIFADQPRRDSTWFLRREIRDPRVEGLNGKWEHLKQWFDKEAITTKALFVALGYDDQYKQLSNHILEAQFKSRHSSFSLRKEGESQYGEAIHRLEGMKSQIEMLQDALLFVMSKEKFSQSLVEKRLYALRQMYNLWNGRVDKVNNKLPKKEQLNTQINKYRQFAKDSTKDIQDLIQHRNSDQGVLSVLRERLEKFRQRTVDELDLLVVLHQAGEERIRLQESTNATQSQFNEAYCYVGENKDQLVCLFDKEDSGVITFLSVCENVQTRLKEAEASLLGKIYPKGTEAQGRLQITGEQLRKALLTKSEELKNESVKFTEQFENFQAWLEAEPRLRQVCEKSTETWKEARLSAMLRLQPINMKSTWRPILQFLGEIKSGLTKPEAERLRNVQVIVQDILSRKEPQQENISNMVEMENQIVGEEIDDHRFAKHIELEQLSKALEESKNNRSQAMVELTKYLARINEGVENKLVEFRVELKEKLQLQIQTIETKIEEANNVLILLEEDKYPQCYKFYKYPVSNEEKLRLKAPLEDVLTKPASGSQGDAKQSPLEFLAEAQGHLANEELTGKDLWKLCQRVYEHNQRILKELQPVKEKLGGNDVITPDLLSFYHDYGTLKARVKKSEEEPAILMKDLQSFFKRTKDELYKLLTVKSSNGEKQCGYVRDLTDKIYDLMIQRAGQGEEQRVVWALLHREDFEQVRPQGQDMDKLKKAYKNLDEKHHSAWYIRRSFPPERVQKINELIKASLELRKLYEGEIISRDVKKNIKTILEREDAARKLELFLEDAARELRPFLQDAQRKIWRGLLSQGEIDRLVHLIENDKVISWERTKVGGTGALKVILKCGIAGVFKGENLKSGDSGKYKNEIATYKLDKLLELNMVPLTVEREITRQISDIIDGKEVMTKITERGSFQLWVENLDENGRSVGSLPPDARFFDLLINNSDRRHLGVTTHNYGYLPSVRAKGLRVDLTLALAGDHGRFVLFDNALSFSALFMSNELLKVSDYKPSPDLLKRVKALTKEQLMSSIEELFKTQIENLLERRNYYIGKIEQEARSASQGGASSV